MSQKRQIQFFTETYQLKKYRALEYTYPCRPLQLNRQYPFTPVTVTDFSMFQVVLNDSVGVGLLAEVAEALNRFKDYVENNGTPPIYEDLIVEKLPVVVRSTNDKAARFYRGEINCQQITGNGRKLNVYLVDIGRNAWVEELDVYLPSVDLIRLPKMAIKCSLSQMVPNNSPTWDPNKDYKKILTGKGKCPSTVQFQSKTNDIWAVFVNVDGIDIGIQAMMIEGIADVPPLNILPQLGGKTRGFPKSDYKGWLGLTIPCFSIKALRYPEVVVQLDGVTANNVQSDIAKYTEVTPGVFKIPFEKRQGMACLSRYNDRDELYRAVIQEVIDLGNGVTAYGVRYVDYGDYGLVKGNMIAYIPEELRSVPECATKVVIGELLSYSAFYPENQLNTEQIALLDKCLKEKDIFCTVVCTSYKWEGRDDGIVVSLRIPQHDQDITGMKVSDLLKIAEMEMEVMSPMSHFGPAISMDMATLLLGLGSRYWPGITYVGVLSCGSTFSSVFLQLEDDSERALKLTREMTAFYTACEGEEIMSIIQGDFATPGTYVAVEQEVDGERGWYRAKVLQKFRHGEKSFAEVTYIDFGDIDHVDMNNVRPLIPYFTRDPVLAVEVSLPVFGALVNDEAQSAAILEYCEFGSVILEVQLGGDGNTKFAWLKKPSSAGLEEWLVENEMVTEVIHNPIQIAN